MARGSLGLTGVQMVGNEPTDSIRDIARTMQAQCLEYMPFTLISLFFTHLFN